MYCATVIDNAKWCPKLNGYSRPRGDAERVGGGICENMIKQSKDGWLIAKLPNPPVPLGCWPGGLDWNLHGLHFICSVYVKSGGLKWNGVQNWLVTERCLQPLSLHLLYFLCVHIVEHVHSYLISILNTEIIGSRTNHGTPVFSSVEDWQ